MFIGRALISVKNVQGMKRSNSGQDLPQKKRAKVASLPEEAQPNDKQLEGPILDSDEFPDLNEVNNIFSDMVPYPTDLMVKGGDFQISAHGIFLFLKSDSLKSIICQPGNSEERTWELDAAITAVTAIEFLKNFYPNVEPEFANLSPKDYMHYYTLVDMHLDSKYLKPFILFFQSQCNDIAASKYSEDAWGELKESFLIFLNLALFMQRSRKRFSRKVLFKLYDHCVRANVHLGIDKIQLFFDFIFAGAGRVDVLVIPCYIALKNNLSFGNITIPEDINWSLSLKNLTKFYQLMIFDNSSIDKGKAHEMFTDLIMWMASQKN